MNLPTLFLLLILFSLFLAAIIYAFMHIHRTLKHFITQEVPKLFNNTYQQIEKNLCEEIAQTARNERTELSVHLSQFQQILITQLGELNKNSDRYSTNIRDTLEKKLKELEYKNEQKLEAIRVTVAEKLHTTLDTRLDSSFKRVSDQLEQVHSGLGEMKALATGVGDLKRLLTNVKTRGTWGEMQLEVLLEQILSPEQYAKNIAPIPGKPERMDFAIRLPGKIQPGAISETEQAVWLPIDAKFPKEDYERLLDAQERADIPALEEAAKALETRIKFEARAIAKKYIMPPITTDFAILFLPIEGLYAEVLRRPGLMECLQRDYRIVIAGPTTFAALLNSLQIGFSTLAIEQRSSEVWQLLGTVKTEFNKFGEVLDKTKIQLENVNKMIDQAQVRTRQMARHLKNIESLPGENKERSESS